MRAKRIVHIMNGANMDINERLESLARSVEGLRETVELLVGMQKDNIERRERTEWLVSEIAEGTARLLAVAEAHQQRLNDHDDRISRLEGTL